ARSSPIIPPLQVSCPSSFRFTPSSWTALLRKGVGRRPRAPGCVRGRETKRPRPLPLPHLRRRILFPPLRNATRPRAFSSPFVAKPSWTVDPACRGMPAAVEVEMLVDERVERPAEEQIARIRGAWTRPVWIEQTRRHAAFAHQLGTVV